jgi:hypothetical protein
MTATPTAPIFGGVGSPRIARRGIESSTRLGPHRWRVERALSWLSRFRRLQLRWNRDSGRWFAFVLVACAVVCFNRLHQASGCDDLLLAYRPGQLSLRLDRWA